MASRINFFQHLAPEQEPDQAQPRGAPSAPVIARCLECLEPANPAWGEDGASFCRNCVPDRLRYPEKFPYPIQEATDEP